MKNAEDEALVAVINYVEEILSRDRLRRGKTRLSFHDNSLFVDCLPEHTFDSAVS